MKPIYIFGQKRINELEDQLVQKTIEVSGKDAEIDNLKLKVMNLVKEKLDLTKKNERLELDYDNLSKANRKGLDELRAKHNNLNLELEHIQRQFNRLKEAYELRCEQLASEMKNVEQLKLQIQSQKQPRDEKGRYIKK